jgi:hypothetical protein
MGVPPGTGDCSGDLPAICKECPDGSCGQPVCVNGVWDFFCSDQPIDDPASCPPVLPQLCAFCPDGTCAQPVCVMGVWDFACQNAPPVPPECWSCMSYDPVCGFDGVTYNAACGPGCVPMGIACRGECPCATSDPCINSRCGDPCDPCAGLPNCFAPDVRTFCDEKLQCTASVPACGAQGNACMVMQDCPAVRLCLPCPDGSCAEQACLNNLCQFVCPVR